MIQLERAIANAIADIRTKRAAAVQRRIFVVHGGHGKQERDALTKVDQFVRSCGALPVVAEESPSGGTSVNRHVRETIQSCDCAIVLATRDRSSTTGATRGNILQEAGLCQEVLRDRLILLLEEGCEMPSNLHEVPYTRFRSTCMEEAFARIVRELLRFGLV